MELKTIAILMTCYNRKEKTMASLAETFNQKIPENIQLQVYLVDDGSTDGTSEAVTQTFPQVKIIPGNGGLFWNGGTRLAFAKALQDEQDYYMWLNDDTNLYPEAIEKLLSTLDQVIKTGTTNPVIVGSTCHPETGNLTYGGMVRSTWWHPLKFKLVHPTEEPQVCHTMNGNCVLIPKSTTKIVGNLDHNFTHSTGDIDYGLRVSKAGGSVWLTPSYVGTCTVNPPETDIWENQNLTFSQRLQKIQQPKGLPFQELKVYTQRHGGLLWPLYLGLPYLRLLLAGVFGGKMGSRVNN
ncbi:MAG: glycosyltransferase family 2 protein [Microcoleaceae cyanobacterium MO_207.B10]|nr:glycosyltransferase family 2 protein [Microcoleaceae cyanobacterium MO_207.B10]